MNKIKNFVSEEELNVTPREILNKGGKNEKEN